MGVGLAVLGLLGFCPWVSFRSFLHEDLPVASARGLSIVGFCLRISSLWVFFLQMFSHEFPWCSLLLVRVRCAAALL